jgi:putative oxidoreductase
MSASSASAPAYKTSTVARSYRAFCAVTHRLRSPFLLFVRLYWGWQFMQTGWGKLHNLSHVTAFFASLGIPAPGVMAPFIALLEFFGGILLIAGLATRLIGLLLAGNTLVAYITADRMALTSILSDPGKFYVADPFTFLFASLLVFIFGAGIFSLDALIDKNWVEPRTPAIE